MRPDFAVVGRGLMGTACARYLAEAGHSVALIGPDEPRDRAGFDGPFGSFHDVGRITRQIASSPVWAELSRRSIARYAEIEAQSGIGFFDPCGSAMVGPVAEGNDMARVAETVSALDLPCLALDGAALVEQLPHFTFAPGAQGFLDQTGGVIHPRKMRQAEERLAHRAGTEIVNQHVTERDGADLRLSGGDTLSAGHVVLATGAYAAAAPLTDAPDMRAYGRTVVLAEVSADEAARLQGLPSLIFWPPSFGYDLYLLPPLRYPDGSLYLKIGGEGDSPVLSSAARARDWFRSTGSAEAAQSLLAALRALMPHLRIERCLTDSCAVSFTSTGQPYIDRITEQATLLTGGNGAGAKCADELGRLGALAALGGSPDAEVAGGDFAARFRTGN